MMGAFWSAPIQKVAHMSQVTVLKKSTLTAGRVEERCSQHVGTMLEAYWLSQLPTGSHTHTTSPLLAAFTLRRKKRVSSCDRTKRDGECDPAS